MKKAIIMMIVVFALVVCTELILEEIKSLKDDIKDKKEGCWQLQVCRNIFLIFPILQAFQSVH